MATHEHSFDTLAVQPAVMTTAAEGHTHPELGALADGLKRHAHPALDAWLTANWDSILERLAVLEGTN